MILIATGFTPVTADHCFDVYVGKQPVALKEYCYVMLKMGLNTIQSINLMEDGSLGLLVVPWNNGLVNCPSYNTEIMLKLGINPFPQ